MIRKSFLSFLITFFTLLTSLTSHAETEFLVGKRQLAVGNSYKSGDKLLVLYVIYYPELSLDSNKYKKYRILMEQEYETSKGLSAHLSMRFFCISSRFATGIDLRALANNDPSEFNKIAIKASSVMYQRNPEEIVTHQSNVNIASGGRDKIEMSVEFEDTSKDCLSKMGVPYFFYAPANLGFIEIGFVCAKKEECKLGNAYFSILAVNDGYETP